MGKFNSRDFYAHTKTYVALIQMILLLIVTLQKYLAHPPALSV